MKFALAHKAATYGMVGFALLAMTSGGGVSPLFLLLGVGGLLGSWFIEPRDRNSKMSILWSAASLLFLLYSVVTAVATGDFLAIGAQFLVWLTVAKACNRRSMPDWQQLYLLAFLMLVAGSVLNAELSYGICFLGFVICSTWALTLFHLRREIEGNLMGSQAPSKSSAHVDRVLNSRRIVERRFFVGTGFLSLAVFIGAAVAFLALPRVGIGFLGRGHAGVTMAGFSDGVTLGGHGVLKNDSTVVMRVEIDPRYGNPSAPQIHWRGVAFDMYRHGQWSRSVTGPSTLSTLDSRGASLRRTLMYDGPALDVDSIDALQRRAVPQHIYLEPLDSAVLFGGSMPRVLEWNGKGNSWERGQEHNDEVRLNHSSTIVYTVWSDVEPPAVDSMRSATGPLPAGYDVYLQLPPEITARTKDLALSITSKLDNNYDKAQAIVQWLGDNLSYTRELEEPRKQEPVDFFLFTRKKGHCEYFATAFALLARAAGIPTRNVNGFLGGEWNGYDNYLAVRAGDAHSWAEVYFPSVGWVTFDATPSGAGDELSRGGGGVRAKLRRFFDTLRFQWTKWVIDYDLGAQLALFASIGRSLKSGARAASVAVQNAARVAWLPTLLVVVAVLLLFAWRHRKNIRISDANGGARSVTKGQREATRMYHDVLRLLARHGLLRTPSQTPREFASMIEQSNVPVAKTVAASLRGLTESYNSAMWDPSAPASELQIMQQAHDAIAADVTRLRRA
jgi:protein-glutamine gamma-glutamyltransferase